MNESLLTSSNDSFELSITENNNETFSSYSLLFDKAKHNFSTSSEISFIKNDLSSIDHNQTVLQETINDVPKEESRNFNPFLLLFIDNDEQQTDRTETNISIDSKESYQEEVTSCVNPHQNLFNIKPTVFHQQRQSKR